MFDGIACLGPAGSFGDAAAKLFFGEADIEAVGRLASSNPDVVHEVANGLAAWGVVPIENSTEGQVGETIDALTKAWQDDNPVYACGTLVLPIEHCFVGTTAVPRPEEVEVIVTHPQAYMQCQRTIQAQIGEHTFLPAQSTAEAVEQMVKADRRSTIAIGSELAARIHGGRILQAAVQDNPNNRTRFLKIGAQDALPEPSGYDTTLVVFSCDDKAGALFRAIEPLHWAGLSMGMIASRPVDLSQYNFCVTFEGHQKQTKVERALSRMRNACSELHVIGSYPTVK